ncbi:MAG TPA: hypothetical protein VIO61_03370 [Anaerolineaceae bacterium]
MIRTLLIILVLLLSACVPADRTPVYQNDFFKFPLRSDWKVKTGSLATGSNALNYYRLDLEIIVQVYRSNSNDTITIAKRVLPTGSGLEKEFEATYQKIQKEIRKDTQGEGIMDQQKALVREYERPWGEPWIRFRDVWIEKGGTIFVLSCKSTLTPSQETTEMMKAIEAGIHFK